MAVYLPQTLLELARLGANIHIEGSEYLPQTLIELANIARHSGAHITISGSYLPNTLTELARIAGKNLTIVISREK